jgi:protease-4
MEQMPDIAKGRVWTGAQAVKIGLVDELGGYDEAMGAVRKALKLGVNDEVSLEILPAPPSPATRLLKLMRHLGAESAMMSSATEALVRIQAALGPLPGMGAAFDQPVAARMRYGVGIHD